MMDFRVKSCFIGPFLQKNVILRGRSSKKRDLKGSADSTKKHDRSN